MMDDQNQERQDHVVDLVNQINGVLAGETIAEACTALTIAVACQIINTSDDDVKKRVSQVRGFAIQLEGFMRRDDIVEWIKASTVFAGEPGRNQ